MMYYIQISAIIILESIISAQGFYFSILSNILQLPTIVFVDYDYLDLLIWKALYFKQSNLLEILSAISMLQMHRIREFKYKEIVIYLGITILYFFLGNNYRPYILYFVIKQQEKYKKQQQFYLLLILLIDLNPLAILEVILIPKLNLEYYDYVFLIKYLFWLFNYDIQIQELFTIILSVIIINDNYIKQLFQINLNLSYLYIPLVFYQYETDQDIRLTFVILFITYSFLLRNAKQIRKDIDLLILRVILFIMGFNYSDVWYHRLSTLLIFFDQNKWILANQAYLILLIYYVTTQIIQLFQLNELVLIFSRMGFDQFQLADLSILSASLYVQYKIFKVKFYNTKLGLAYVNIIQSFITQVYLLPLFPVLAYFGPSITKCVSISNCIQIVNLLTYI